MEESAPAPVPRSPRRTLLDVTVPEVAEWEGQPCRNSSPLRSADRPRLIMELRSMYRDAVASLQALRESGLSAELCEYIEMHLGTFASYVDAAAKRYSLPKEGGDGVPCVVAPTDFAGLLDDMKIKTVALALGQHPGGVEVMAHNALVAARACVDCYSH